MLCATQEKTWGKGLKENWQHHQVVLCTGRLRVFLQERKGSTGRVSWRLIGIAVKAKVGGRPV